MTVKRLSPQTIQVLKVAVSLIYWTKRDKRGLWQKPQPLILVAKSSSPLLMRTTTCRWL